MGLRDFFRRKRSRAAAPPPAHAVIVRFTYGSTDLGDLFALEEALEQTIAAAEAGELDGNVVAIDGSDAALYMYGPDADVLFETVRPLLEGCTFMRDARATLRYGPPEDEVREREVRLGE